METKKTEIRSDSDSAPNEGKERIESLNPVNQLSNVLPSRVITSQNIEKFLHANGATKFDAKIKIDSDTVKIFAAAGDNIARVFFGFRMSDRSLVCIRMPCKKIFSEKPHHRQAMELRFARARRFLAQRMNDPTHYWAQYFQEAVINHPEKPDERMACTVMEAVSGISLWRLLIHSNSAISNIVRSPQFVLALAIQLCHAIELYEEEGCILRDFKPENIFIVKPEKDDVFVKLFDAEALRTKDSAITSPGLVAGTVEYMSPENASGKDIDIRTDLYAVGVIMYQLLSGGLPFCGGSSYSIMEHHIKSPLPPITTNVPDVLKDIVRNFLEKPKEKRPPDAASARELLVDYYNSVFPGDPFAPYLKPALEI